MHSITKRQQPAALFLIIHHMQSPAGFKGWEREFGQCTVRSSWVDLSTQVFPWKCLRASGFRWSLYILLPQTPSPCSLFSRVTPACVFAVSLFSHSPLWSRAFSTVWAFQHLSLGAMLPLPPPRVCLISPSRGWVGWWVIVSPSDRLGVGCWGKKWNTAAQSSSSLVPNYISCL